MANIIGSNGNDTLAGSDSKDTLNGGACNEGDDTLAGGGGKDQFVYNYNAGIDTITDFGGVGKGINPSAGVIAEVDTIKFQQDAGFTAQNLLLTQNGNNLEITFEGIDDAKVILQNFALENLDNLSKSTGATVDLGNIEFDGQTSTTDSFDVFNANSTQSTIFNKNTVTFLNDLSNNVNGFDNSDDVINGPGGDDKIDGKSGNDLLRGGTGNDTLIGGAGNDRLDGVYSTGNNIFNGGSGSDTLNLYYSTGNNSLSGDEGNDVFYINYSTGNNTLSGGDGADSFYATGIQGINIFNGGNGDDSFSLSVLKYPSSDLTAETVDGGTGDDTLSINYSNANGAITSTFNATTKITSITAGTNQVTFKNIERLNIIGTDRDDRISGVTGNDTIIGGAGNDVLGYGAIMYGGTGNDYLSVYSSSNNSLLFGNDGNDSLDASGEYYGFGSGNNTLHGGAGDDYLIAFFATGNNILDGGDGNDYLSISES